MLTLLDAHKSLTRNQYKLIAAAVFGFLLEFLALGVGAMIGAAFFGHLAEPLDRGYRRRPGIGPARIHPYGRDGRWPGPLAARTLRRAQAVRTRNRSVAIPEVALFVKGFIAFLHSQ